MLEIKYTNQFKKDVKLLSKQGKKLDKLYDIIDKISKEEVLPEKNRNHSLSGNFRDFMECHIEPDWLLVYFIEKDILVLTLVRTGSHSDLF